MDLLSREFVCYGYKKVTKHLQRSGYIINRKKVFRILKENNLLNYTYNYRSPARRVVESIVRIHTPNEVWEMDIKYVYIHGENRTAYLFAIIDCYTREVVGKYMGYHCTSQDVKTAIDFAFLDRGIMQIKNVRIRSDNGTQFVSRIVELFLSSSNIAH
jgi:putative transposase